MEGGVSRWLQLMVSLAVVLVWCGAVALTLFFTQPFTVLRGWLLAGSSLAAAAGAVYAGFFWRSCHLTLTNQYIEYRSGILYQINRRIRLSSIMAVTVVKCPFPKPEIASLLVSAMGGSMLLPLLDKKDAEKLLALLLPSENTENAEKTEGMDDAGNVV